MAKLSFAQFVTLQVIGILSSCLSIIGSSLIITSITRQQKQQKHLKRNTLHQLLLGLSLSDIVATLTILLFNVTNPKNHSNGPPWALGNQATCSASAFCYVLAATAANFYNMFMSIHFHRMVTSSQKRSILSQSQEQKDRWFRIGAHSMSIIIPLIFSIAGIIADTYNYDDFLGVCYYAEYPHGCDIDPNVECETGSRSRLMRIPRNVLASGVALISIIFTVKLTLHVWANIDRAGRYSFRKRLSQHFMKKQRVLQPKSHQTDTNPSAQQQLQESQRDKERKEVAAQALWYMLAYLNTFFFLVLVGVVLNVTDARDNPGSPGPYTILIMLWCTQPLQGALNFLVFIRPRYNAWKLYFEKRQQRDPENNPLPSVPEILAKAVLEQVPASRQCGLGGHKPPPGDKYKHNIPELDQDQRSFTEGQYQSVTCSMTEDRVSTTLVGSSVSRSLLPTIPQDAVDFSNSDGVDNRGKDGLYQFKLDEISQDDIGVDQ